MIVDCWDVIEDILDSLRMADDTQDKHIHATVVDYVVNHYGDD